MSRDETVFKTALRSTGYFCAMNKSLTDAYDIDEAYPSWVVLIHWVTVALVLLAAGAVLGRELVEDRSLRAALMIVHRGAGLMVLAVTLLRLAVSPWVIHRKATPTTPLLKTGALLSHLSLYLVLLANPIVGWALSSARGQVAYFLGVIALPSLVAKDRDFADTLQEAHESVAIALLVIVALHSAAALWHHFIRRDAVLLRMTALRKARG